MQNCETCVVLNDGSYGCGRFCSEKCARSFSTKNRRKAINQQVSQKLRGRQPVNPFKIGHQPSREMRTKISVAARIKFDAWIATWLAGSVVSGRSACDKIKRYLLEKFRGCQRCGWSQIHPFTEIIPVQLHHIDGNHLNNHPDNVELLCPNCHSLTPNYMALNKGTPCPGKRYN